MTTAANIFTRAAWTSTLPIISQTNLFALDPELESQLYKACLMFIAVQCILANAIILTLYLSFLAVFYDICIFLNCKETKTSGFFISVLTFAHINREIRCKWNKYIYQLNGLYTVYILQIIMIKNLGRSRCQQCGPM